MCRELASPLVSLGTRVSISSSEHVYVQDYCSEEGNYEFSLPPLQSMNTRFPSKVTLLNFWGPSFACGVSGGSILQYARTIKHLGHGLSTRRRESTGEDHRDAWAITVERKLESRSTLTKLSLVCLILVLPLRSSFVKSHLFSEVKPQSMAPCSGFMATAA